MAKALRKQAWDKYEELKKQGASKKGSPLVSWGWISVDLDRLDTALFKALPGGQLSQMGNLDVSDLKILQKNLDGKKTGVIEIYDTEIKGKVLTNFWHIDPRFVAVKGAGQVDFEGATARVIVDELENLYTSYGDFVEDVRKRDKTGGFVLEHGNQGTGQALSDSGNDAATASKKLQGLKAQKEVLSAISTALKSLPVDVYTTYLECAIFDWVDANFDLTNMLKKGRTINAINDEWGGQASITLGRETIPPLSIPKNSRKVDNVIRKAFLKWVNADFIKSVLKFIRNAPLKERLKLFSASKNIDQALIDYSAGKFAFIFTKTGTIDKRYKINKELLKLAKADMAASKLTNTGKGKTQTKRKNAKGGKKGDRAKKHLASVDHPLALKEMLNAVLPEEILKNMGRPALVNRTGRFRNSAEITNALVGPKGGVQIDYTYMRDPYETFEPGGAQGSTNRDPRRLIGNTIRELAQEIMGKKFIKTRRV